jgi:hypothetical protein
MCTLFLFAHHTIFLIGKNTNQAPTQIEAVILPSNPWLWGKKPSGPRTIGLTSPSKSGLPFVH